MKRVLAMCAVVCLLLGLWACGNETANPTDTQTTGGPQEDKLTVTLYHDLNTKTGAILENRLAAFTQNNPHIRVELKKCDGQLTGEEAGGIVLCDKGDVAQYRQAGWVMDLASLVTEEQLADYQMFYAVDPAELYSLPVMFSSLVLYYNRSFFDVNDIPVPFSWEEVEETCQKIKKLDPDATPLMCDAGADLFLSVCYQQDVAITDEAGTGYLFDTEKAQDFVKRLNSWSQKGWLSAQTQSGEVLQQWSSGNGYMVIGSSADALRYRAEKEGDTYLFELGVAHMPQSLDAAAGVAIRSLELCVLKTDDEQLQAASWQLAQYMSADTAFQADFPRAAGYLPAVMSAEADAGYNAFLDSADGGDNVAAQAAMTCLEQQYAFAVLPVSDPVRQQLDALVGKCLGLSGDNVDAQITEAFREAVKNCENS
jgi:multiple sugar transport system substrate-binding protein